jgi:hypothetical protein
MATLEFAFLAEYAKVEANATITAVGAGVRGVGVPAENGEFVIFVAGSVDRERGEGAAALTITVEAPHDKYQMSQSAAMDAAPSTGDFATTVFAFGLNVPVVGLGKYAVRLELNETEVGNLDLWVGLAPSVTTAGD